MGVRQFEQYFFVLFYLASREGHCRGETCAAFYFPEVNNSWVSIEENTSLSFQFGIDIRNCPEHAIEKFSIIVTKFDKEGRTGGIRCTLVHKKRKCLPSLSKECKCKNENGLYRFRKVVNRDDNTTWKWSVDNRIAEEKEIVFDVKYAARVTDIVLMSDFQLVKILNKNAEGEIICFWEDGNPPVKARMLDRHGVELNSSIDSRGQIRYKFPAVSCQDAGLIRCEAPGATGNKTLSLLVKCRPLLKLERNLVIVKQTETAELTVGVQSYTEDMTCFMQKIFRTEETRRPHLCNMKGLIGTPPNLTLTVRLDNVTIEDEGEWRLNVTNAVGTGSVDFQIQIENRITRKTTEPGVMITRDGDLRHTNVSGTTLNSATYSVLHDDVSDSSTVATVIVCVVVGILMVGCVAVMILKREGRLHFRLALRSRERDSDSVASEHFYEEAREGPVELELVNLQPPVAEPEPLNVLPEDYLHPTVSNPTAQGAPNMAVRKPIPTPRRQRSEKPSLPPCSPQPVASTPSLERDTSTDHRPVDDETDSTEN